MHRINSNAGLLKVSKNQHVRYDAGIAQLVEHDLAKVGVASSSLVSRSNIFSNQS